MIAHSPLVDVHFPAKFPLERSPPVRALPGPGADIGPELVAVVEPGELVVRSEEVHGVGAAELARRFDEEWHSIPQIEALGVVEMGVQRARRHLVEHVIAM